MSRSVVVPRELTYAPFVGRDAVEAGLITRAQLSGAVCFCATGERSAAAPRRHCGAPTSWSVVNRSR